MSCKKLQDSADPACKYQARLSTAMTLTTDCTPEKLYGHLNELGADIKKLKKRNPSLVELERMYYELLDVQLSSRSKRASKNRFG